MVRNRISLLLHFFLYLPLLILVILLLLDCHVGEGVAVEDCGDSDGRHRRQRRTAPKTTMEWDKKRYIVFSSSFLQHLPLLILLLLDRHAGEEVADTDEGSENDDGIGQKKVHCLFFFLFYSIFLF